MINKLAIKDLPFFKRYSQINSTNQFIHLIYEYHNLAIMVDCSHVLKVQVFAISKVGRIQKFNSK